MWESTNWIVRQATGSSKWGGIRSTYWIQRIDFDNPSDFSILMLFEIYGGGATMSVNLKERNTKRLYYTVTDNNEESLNYRKRFEEHLKSKGWGH